ncbi:MAG: polysaccharide biosynthesis protein [Minisyncoccales bacterium]
MRKLIQQILLKKRRILKLILFLLTDTGLIISSVFLAFLLRFEGIIPERYWINIEGIICFALLITLPVFYFFRLYHFTWAYVSTAELMALSKATSLSFLLLTALYFVLREQPVFSGFPRSTLFLTYFFIFVLTGGLRFAKRLYLQFFRPSKTEKERTLIVGAGDAGEQILRSILSSRDSVYLPVGFVDDHPAKQGILIHNLEVLGRIKDIPAIVKKYQIETLIIALPSVRSYIIRQAVEMGRKAGLKKIKIIPSIHEIINGRVSFQQLREVNVGDLLGRDHLSLEEDLIAQFIEGKRILVTGAAGSIGSELCRQIAKFKPSLLILLDQDETGIFNLTEELEDIFPKIKKQSLVADIKDKDKIEQIFQEFKPEIVFHAAAYKHVPLMEENPDIAIKNNIFGAKTVVEAALNNEVEKFIFISTDKAINPTSVMGATKRVGEMICQAFNQQEKTKFISVRFGNVLDSRGNVIALFSEKIKKREPIEITHPEMKRYFMITSEACLLVLQAAVMGRGGEVFVLDMGNPIKIIDLAKEMIRLSGLEPDKDIPIVFTEPRPGEKLFEEILTAEEGTVATKHQKIFIAKLAKVDQEKLNSGLAKLEKIIATGQLDSIRQALKELVVNYDYKK